MRLLDSLSDADTRRQKIDSHCFFHVCEARVSCSQQLSAHTENNPIECSKNYWTPFRMNQSAASGSIPSTIGWQIENSRTSPFNLAEQPVPGDFHFEKCVSFSYAARSQPVKMINAPNRTNEKFKAIDTVNNGADNLEYFAEPLRTEPDSELECNVANDGHVRFLIFHPIEKVF